MPKEHINPRHHGTDTDPAPFVEVGWDRLGYVQIATLAGGDYDEGGTSSGPPPRVTVNGDASEGTTLTTGTRVVRPGFYADLDRDGINRLIRLLRKARDAAFGADA